MERGGEKSEFTTLCRVILGWGLLRTRKAAFKKEQSFFKTRFDFSQVANFCTELPYLSEPRWITSLQTSHATECNIHLSKDIKIEAFLCCIHL
jgi:hypothetical protein